ncbi:DNA excision repair protein ERCC-5 isoform X2 [Amyelois transitella]|nr:DNA excision repair protein ERCC-5 isoform X2 [Amyelois transitella]
MNSWGKLHELPKKSDNFSDFQLQRLLKRRKVQECLEETEKEMGDGGMSLNDIESLLNEEGIDTKIDALPTRRIASNNTTRFVLINNVKQALENAKKKKLEAVSEMMEKHETKIEKSEELQDNHETKIEKFDELEDDLQKAIKMSLECVDDQDTNAQTSKDLDSSAYTSKTDDSWTSNLSDSDNYHYDSEEEDGFEQPDMTSAKAYIMQYSDFTHKAIDQIVSSENKYNKNKQKDQRVDGIIDELNKEKSIITEEVELSSGDEEVTENDNQFNILPKIETLSSDEDSVHIKTNEATQMSVMFIENPTQEIVCLDTSLEDNTEEYLSFTKHPNKTSESSETDDEFEDVPETVKTTSKTVVELTLNMGSKPEDDIFADVFTNSKYDPNVKSKPNNSNNASPVIKKILDDDAISKLKDVENNDNSEIDTRNSEIQAINSTISKYVHFSHIEREIKTLNEHVNAPKVCDNADEIIDESVHDKKEIINTKAVISSTENEMVHNIKNTDIINKTTVPKVDPAVTDKLNSMVNEMENEEQDLLQEKGRLDRVGRNITEQMTKEAQELLQIFGIPYIVAPMEAEAQCAFLEAAKLTDGTITDDSDIWLFGGKTVYKNFFNQKKHVLQFLSERIEKSFNLTREHLVLLALLVGSDYTTGLTGVGPVTALEILASFPFNKKKLFNDADKQCQYQEIITGLQEFKKWVKTGKRTDNTTLKKKLKNVDVTDDFPSIRVVQAYLDPNVEKSKESFTWGEMDITVLRDYTKAKFGWSQNKLDEIIKPVLKRLEDRKSQKNIHDYFKKKVEFQSLDEHMSKRVKEAVQRMGPEDLLGLENPTEIADTKKKVRKRKTKNAKDSGGNDSAAGPSKPKQNKSNEDNLLDDLGVKVVSKVHQGKSTIEITIPKSDRVQEIIPQREKDKQSLLQNKMKAIEIFRKSKLDQKKKTTKRRIILPKAKAELSESDSD